MESIRTGLRNIMGELLRTRSPEEAALLAWPVVCGKDVAARTRAASFADGCLTIEVTDATWAAQLKSFSSSYINGFQALLGPMVKELKFKVQQSAFSTQHSAKPQKT